MTQNPSLCVVTAHSLPIVELGRSLSSLAFSRLPCDLCTGPKIALRVRAATEVQRGYRHYRHHASSKCKVHGAAHFVVIDLPLMRWSITLLRAMRSLCRAPRNSNDNLPAQEAMNVSPERKHIIFTGRKPEETSDLRHTF